MNIRPSPASLLLLISLAGCASAPPAPPRATGSAEALALAEKVVTLAGGVDGWASVKRLSFTVDGVRNVDWDRAAGYVHIDSLTADSPWKSLDYDLGANQAAVAPTGAVEDPRATAKAIWDADTWRFLVTLRVLEPEVTLAIDEPQPEDSAGVARLRLKITGNDATTTRECVLYVRTADGAVLRQDDFPSAEAAPKSWRFEEFGRYGPLWLSTWRPGIAGAASVRFSDVRIR